LPFFLITPVKRLKDCGKNESEEVFNEENLKLLKEMLVCSRKDEEQRSQLHVSMVLLKLPKETVLTKRKKKEKKLNFFPFSYYLK